ncbi:MAG: hypothetical protein EXR48_01500 [Dehalococcoidia bacterium]|nr:hypothetical protein [Dehalococcoidia bacterium]
MAGLRVGSKGKVANLFLCLKRRGPLVAVQQARALLGYGLEGDCHTKRRLDAPNQVLLMDTGVLKAHGLKPGQLREQVTVDFPPLHALPAGSLLRVGQAVLQISGHCVPCLHIGEMAGVKDPEAFRRSLEKQRGMLASVVSAEGDGWVRMGDSVEVLSVEREPARVMEEAKGKSPYR